MTPDSIAPPPAVSRRRVAFFAASLIAYLALIARAYQTTNDTRSYVEHNVVRTPLYPLFLDICRLLGGAHMFKVAQALQILLGFVAAAILTQSLAKRLKLGPFAFGLVYALLLVPFARFGDVIGTESLSYALFLAFLRFLFGGLAEPNDRDTVGVAAISALALLARPQFLFLAPTLGLYLLWLFYARRPWRRNLAAVALVAGGACFSTLAQDTYNYVFNRAFMTIPFTGIQVLTVAAYNAAPTDRQYLDADSSSYFDELYSRMHAERLLEADRDPTLPISTAFLLSYNPTIHAITDKYQEHFHLAELGTDDFHNLDHLTLHLGLSLWRHHLRDNVRHLIKEVQENSGHLALLVAAAGALAALGFWRTRDRAFLFVVAAAVLCASNYLLVILVEPLGTRYAIYTENIQLPIWIAVGASLYRRIDWKSVGPG